MSNRDDIIKEHVLSLAKDGDYGICSPPLNAQTAIYELCRHFLGDDWYTSMPMNAEQVNTNIVYEIERRYCGDRAARKKLKKRYDNENSGTYRIYNGKSKGIIS